MCTENMHLKFEFLQRKTNKILRLNPGLAEKQLKVNISRQYCTANKNLPEKKKHYRELKF